jgi:ATP-dependent DNA helicase PIF1
MNTLITQYMSVLPGQSGQSGQSRQNRQPTQIKQRHSDSTLNTEQQLAFDMVADRKNVLITGSAGCGKSFTVSKIVEWANENGIKIAVTAMTGTAALLIGGRTLHSFLSIGLASKSAQELATAALKKKGVPAKLRKLDVLLIDEISMMDDVLFAKVSEFLSLIRKRSLPFGGLQLVLCGDFAQIPPVHGDFCFKSPEWKRANITTAMLTKLVRQENDTEFQKILEELRWGVCTKSTLRTLAATKNTPFADGIAPTMLFSKNVNVDAINDKKYKELVSAGAVTQAYPARFSDNSYTATWAASCKIPETIELSVGAQVMSTVNQPDGDVVNGSRGVVTELTSIGPKVRFAAGNGHQRIVEYYKQTLEDEETVFVEFIPLKLAYALTLHKSQGVTLDCAEMSLGPSIFEYGMAYTGISRVRDLNSVRIIDVLASSFRTHPDVMSFYGKGK